MRVRPRSTVPVCPENMLGNIRKDLEHYRIMPRTMLRCAIEKFGPEERERYLKGLG